MTLPEIYEADIARKRSSLEWEADVESALWVTLNDHLGPFFFLTIDHVQVYSTVSFDSRKADRLHFWGAEKGLSAGPQWRQRWASNKPNIYPHLGILEEICILHCK